MRLTFLISWWAREDSNFRPLPCQGSAVQNSHRNGWFCFPAITGFTDSKGIRVAHLSGNRAGFGQSWAVNCGW
jgi:hypothetical protein